MRDFQQKGLKAIEGHSNELLLLEGRGGPAYFLVPVQENNLDGQRQELERAMALANLNSWQQRALELGLTDMTLEEINNEIDSVRNRKS